MSSSGRCPTWFHQDAAQHVGFDIIDTRRCRCEEGCNRKEKVVESNGMRSEPFVFQAACCFLLLVVFPRCCAPLSSLFSSFHVVFLYYTQDEFGLYTTQRVLEFNLK
ncbi:hypothetical protein RchiOBHm_Chr4g0402791 [Rosa chinensis]|uniref:Uncharacterized protein n=1 Tax=Rosa chinensis TaxID=74649 RepID=A0A2P6QTG7_ROSCH|nr:hypothetical protein RchiOBHm_Chr4g0402791 [Rosa chinensis]